MNAVDTSPRCHLFELGANPDVQVPQRTEKPAVNLRLPLGQTGNIQECYTVGDPRETAPLAAARPRRPMADLDVLDLEEGTGETGVSSSFCLVGKFEDEDDKRNVCLEGPWSIMNNLLILQPLKEGMVVSEVDFSTCPIWVQIHGLPVEKMTCANSEIIGKRFGRLLAMETASDNFLLARSFLRVRVEINIPQPLAKGFWLKGKSGTNRDRWIAYKYEKLPDYCYACGRIGNEKKGCRFAHREEDAHSGYGPDLRMGRPRKGVIPIEVIRFEVDEAEKRVNNLLQRQSITLDSEMGMVDNLLLQRPESQSKNSEARGNSILVERVTTPKKGQCQQEPGIKAPHSPGTRVTMQGTPYISVSVSDPKENLDFVPSDLIMTRVGFNSLHLSNIGTISKERPIQATTHTSAHYFVTEPDSPKALQTNPRPDSNINLSQPNLSSPTLALEQIDPNPNPKPPPSNSNQNPITQTESLPSSASFPNNLFNSTTDSLSLSPLQLPSPSTLVSSLSNVFNSLSIKRKAQDKLLDFNKSKILHLCSPDPNPNPIIPKPTPKKTKGTRNSKSPRRMISSSSKMIVNEQGLCEVQIQPSFEVMEMDDAFPPVDLAAVNGEV
ncbi:hypothetical protein RHSIM_Rhsim10G0112000 [Rhododendron simsii]|uniref:Zinc knuckle CX2CX4HX4C domain-containing protein n=1 Tax=Rhododendron simsii TaxID=118357 RepID=A0A834GDD8_RHOSS|nr:hypothetical protein RHSIM_Rhsim10G0112000 [Rhododendron simsii]